MTPKTLKPETQVPDPSSESADVIREVLQRRLDFTHDYLRALPGSLFRVDESGFQAITKACGGGIGFALYLLHDAFPTAVTLLEHHDSPYVITGEHIRARGKSIDDYERWQEVEKHVVVFDVDAANAETAAYSEEQLATLSAIRQTLQLFHMALLYEHS